MLCYTDQVYADLSKYDDDNAMSGDLNHITTKPITTIYVLCWVDIPSSFFWKLYKKIQLV